MISNKIIEKKGVVFFVEYNENIPYEKMAYYAIKSLKYFNPAIKVAVIYCNDYKNIIQKKLESICDYLININPINDNFGKNKKISNLYQIYWASPFEENIYFDCDFLFSGTINHYFNYLNNTSFCFSSNSLDYRLNEKDINYKLNFFKKHEIPFVNNQIFMFKKNNDSLEFFNLWSQISNNFNTFYNEYLKYPYDVQDINIDISLALKLSDNTESIINNLDYWIDLRPSKINYTDQENKDFYNYVNFWCIKGPSFKFENYILNSPIHYKDPNFLNDFFCKYFEEYF